MLTFLDDENSRTGSPSLVHQLHRVRHCPFSDSWKDNYLAFSPRLPFIPLLGAVIFWEKDKSGHHQYFQYFLDENLLENYSSGTMEKALQTYWKLKRHLLHSFRRRRSLRWNSSLDVFIGVDDSRPKRHRTGTRSLILFWKLLTSKSFEKRNLRHLRAGSINETNIVLEEPVPWRQWFNLYEIGDSIQKASNRFLVARNRTT